MAHLRRAQEFLVKRQGEILAAFAMFTGPAVNLVYGILVVRNLDPEMAGLISNASLLPVYLTFLHFGVLNGMQRELPYALGARNTARAEKILQLTTKVSRLAGLVGALVCVGAGIITLLLHKPALLAVAYFGSAFGALAYQMNFQVDTGLRAENRFLRQGLAVISTNAISLISCILIPLAGAKGAIARGVLASIGSIVVRLRTGVWREGGSWDWAELRALARTGLPLLISGTLVSLMMVSDRTVVAIMLSHRDLGEIALAALIVNSMTLFPVSLSVVLFPKIARAYGEHRSRRKLRRFVWISLVYNAATLIPISALAYFLIGPIVETYFPKYIPGLPAARLACVTCVFWVYMGVGSVIGVINRMTGYLCVFAVCLLMMYGLAAVLIHLGYGIIGATWARLVGTVLMCICTITYSIYLTSEDDKPEGPDAAN
ncbi:MAG: oligosaccharide flippase family protein [Verrucomicrobiales bacterium]|nr:oligosaccharide flippase family protein [Verrucomicrobiales bacterium]